MKTDIILTSISKLTRILQEGGSDLTEHEVLFWLRDRRYLVAHHGERYNAPSDLCLELGYMVHHRTFSESSGGGVLIGLRPMFTQAGYTHILPKLQRYSYSRHDIRD